MITMPTFQSQFRGVGGARWKRLLRSRLHWSELIEDTNANFLGREGALIGGTRDGAGAGAEGGGALGGVGRLDKLGEEVGWHRLRRVRLELRQWRRPALI